MTAEKWVLESNSTLLLTSVDHVSKITWIKKGDVMLFWWRMLSLKSDPSSSHDFAAFQFFDFEQETKHLGGSVSLSIIWLVVRIRWDEACKVWCLTYSYSKYLHTVIYIFKQRSRSQKNIFQISTRSLASFNLLHLKTIFRIDPKKNMSVEEITVYAYLIRGREVKIPGFFIIKKSMTAWGYRWETDVC